MLLSHLECESIDANDAGMKFPRSLGLAVVVGAFWWFWPESEVTVSQIPPELNGNWFNVSHAGPPRVYTRITQKEIIVLSTDGHSESYFPTKIKMHAEAGKSDYFIRIFCRSSRGTYSSFGVVRKGDDLIFITETRPTGFDDETYQDDLGYFARDLATQDK